MHQLATKLQAACNQRAGYNASVDGVTNSLDFNGSAEGPKMYLAINLKDQKNGTYKVDVEIKTKAAPLLNNLKQKKPNKMKTPKPVKRSYLSGVDGWKDTASLTVYATDDDLIEFLLGQI